MTYQVIVIFSDEVVQMNFLLLCLDKYLFCLTLGNTYLPRGSKENVGFNNIIENVTMCRYVMPVVTTLF